MSTTGNDNYGYSGGSASSASSGGYGSGGGGSNYNYSSTPTGQGNWNTGGVATGFGSFGNGIVGVGGNPRYTVAPDGSNPHPQWGDMIRQILGPRITPTGSPISTQPLPASPPIPIPRQNPFAKFTGPPLDVMTPPVRMDPGVLNHMINSSYPTPAGIMNSGFKDQTRMPGYASGGFSGGGMGGGGGGGW